MKLRSNLTISLLSVLLLAACAPAIAPNPVEPEASTPLASLENEPAVMPTPTPAEIQSQASATKGLSTEAPAEVPQAVASSRGPHLEATDPSTYTRASGEIQLVEFFAFW
jgi:hypothetical protein